MANVTHQKIKVKPKFILLFFFIIPLIVNAQNDSINQWDEMGRKQGLWVYYGDSLNGYPEDSIVKKGLYINDQKIGVWTKYHPNGVVLLKGEYYNNRSVGFGYYNKYNSAGILIEKGTLGHHRYHGEQFKYYDSGTLMMKIVHPDEFSLQNKYDFYEYSPDECIIRYHATPCDSTIKALTINYSRDSCGLVLDTIIHYRHRPAGDSIVWNSSNCEYENEFTGTGSIRGSYRSIVVNHAYLYSDTYIGYIQPSGKIILRDEFKHLKVFKGVTKNKEVWKGKFYFYSDDGTLFHIEKWRNGELLRVKKHP